MTLKEYYGKLKKQKRPPHPAREFILTIAEKTGKSTKTIQQWMSGIYTPSRETQIIISDATGIPPDELFPAPE